MKKNILLNVKEFQLRKFFISGALTVFGLASVANLSAQVTGTKTVGATGNYSTIADAITFINANGGVGTSGVVLELQSDYSVAKDSILSITGSSAANPVIVRPAASVVSPLSITNAADTVTTLKMKGCSYVTIDGRSGGTGTTSMLTVSNASGGVGGVAVRLYGDAQHNTIQYVTLKSANNSIGASGTVFFGKGATMGVSYNVIDHCNITDISSTQTPAVAIYSAGVSATYLNANNTISNCNISNYYTATSTGDGGYGIQLAANNTAWTITSNSFYNNDNTDYNTAKWPAIYAINLNNTGDGYTINGNFIGGTAAQCGGAPYTLGGTLSAKTTGPQFRAIYFSAGTTNLSTISNNTIKNLVINTGTANGGVDGAYQYFINVKAGKVNVNGNILGSQSGTGSIILNYACNATSSQFLSFYGILNEGIGAQGDVTIDSNTIGGITFAGNDYLPSSYTDNVSSARPKIRFTGIAIKARTSGTVTVSNNIIGNTSTGITDGSQMSIQNMITRPSTAGSAFSDLTEGINCAAGTGATVVLDNNTIANIYGSNMKWAALRGIETSNTPTSITISNNTIRDLIGAANSDFGSGNTRWTSGGIYYNCNTVKASASIYGNKIYNLSSSVADVFNDGILIYSTGGAIVYKNLIYNIVPASYLANYTWTTGIRTVYSATTSDIYNNIIRLGSDKSGNSISGNYAIYGIREDMGTNNLYFNTVLLAGSGVASSVNTTYAFYSAIPATTAREIKNNIFINNITVGNTEKHFAVRTTAIAAASATIVNNNDYVSGSGYVGDYNGASTAAILSDWQTVTGQDANSLSVSPVFVSATDLHLSQTNTANSALNKGVSVSLLTSDIDGDLRGGTPTLGADEYKGPGTATQNLMSNELSVYSSQKGNITVDGLKDLSANNRVVVCNFVGQKVFDQKLTASTQRLNNSFAQGTYIVAIDVNGSKEVHKVIVR